MLKEMIDEFYRKEESPYKRDYFYVSEVDDCKRKIYFKMKGAPKEDLDPVTNRKFERGDQIHQMLVSTMYSLGIVTASEIRMPDDSLFHGRADAIVSVDGENYVVEIKSTNPYGFKAMDEPKSSWRKQIQLYLHYFDLEKGILLAECKGTQKLKEFLVERDEDLAKRIISDFEKLKGKVDRGVVPKKPSKEGWEYDKCQYCRYAEICRENSGSLNEFVCDSP